MKFPSLRISILMSFFICLFLSVSVYAGITTTSYARRQELIDKYVRQKVLASVNNTPMPTASPSAILTPTATPITALRTHTPLPSKSIVVSLDDGYQDVYDYAFPTAKKYNIKLSLMVPTGLMGVNAGTNTYYSWGELKDMVHSGLAEADNHTFSHAVMGANGPAKDQFEVETAQQQLHDNIGITPFVFAWPYGTNATNPNEYPVLIKNGIQGAFSTIGGTYQCDSFIYSLHRTRVGNISFPAFGIY